VALRIYLRNRRIKVEIAIARGKKMYDKRETELRRTVDREMRAQLKQRNK
jgi:SsrA-binding protein